jgi:hypothetical protein
LLPSEYQCSFYNNTEFEYVSLILDADKIVMLCVVVTDPDHWFVSDVSLHGLYETFAVNTFGPIMMAKHFAPLLMKGKWHSMSVLIIRNSMVTYHEIIPLDKIFLY